MGIANATHWSEAVRACEEAGRDYVIVTLLGVQGSTPRGNGCKMVLDGDHCHGSIGGGELEHRAQKRARELLIADRPAQRLENFPLGEKLGQCCGGSASLLFESFSPRRLHVYLFGAGHVGRALAPLLAALPLRLRWIDSRPDAFSETPPAGVHCDLAEEPIDRVREAPSGSAFIVMTHQHPLDLALVDAVLRREDAAFVGLIGSRSKWQRFRLRLLQRGFSEAALDAVRCPVGLAQVPGKLPAEIAVSVAAQLIAHYHAERGDSEHTGPGWKTQRRLLAESGALPHLVNEQSS